MTILETNIDDAPSEILGAFYETAFRHGALDVYHVPVMMKKNRPAFQLSVMCEPFLADQITELILRETTAFGVRRSQWERKKLQRTVQTVDTQFGTVEVKVGSLNGQIVQCAPEFESCHRLAKSSGKALFLIYQEALRAFTDPVNDTTDHKESKI